MEVKNLQKFQCEDCGLIFYIDSFNEDCNPCCPICTIPRVDDEGTNIIKIENKENNNIFLDTESQIKRQIKQYLHDHVDVYISHNNEIGDLIWAVVVVDSDEFWLETFKIKEKAIEYCNDNKLKITKIIDYYK
jgi:hypothetical protein